MADARASWRGAAQRGVTWRGVVWRPLEPRGVAWQGVAWRKWAIANFLHRNSVIKNETNGNVLP